MTAPSMQSKQAASPDICMQDCHSHGMRRCATQLNLETHQHAITVGRGLDGVGNNDDDDEHASTVAHIRSLRGWGVVYLLYLLACALQYRYLDNIRSRSCTQQYQLASPYCSSRDVSLRPTSSLIQLCKIVGTRTARWTTEWHLLQAAATRVSRCRRPS
jgi:hypothetical protein